MSEMSFLHVAYLLKHFCLLLRCNKKGEVFRYTEVPLRNCIWLPQNKQVKKTPSRNDCFVTLL